MAPKPSDDESTPTTAATKPVRLRGGYALNVWVDPLSDYVLVNPGDVLPAGIDPVSVNPADWS